MRRPESPPATYKAADVFGNRGQGLDDERPNAGERNNVRPSGRSYQRPGFTANNGSRGTGQSYGAPNNDTNLPNERIDNIEKSREEARRQESQHQPQIGQPRDGRRTSRVGQSQQGQSEHDTLQDPQIAGRSDSTAIVAAARSGSSYAQSQTGCSVGQQTVGCRGSGTQHRHYDGSEDDDEFTASEHRSGGGSKD
ncbi:hypothetical protein BDV12DRAFT_200654 [Aspergillus spectabilis]